MFLGLSRAFECPTPTSWGRYYGAELRYIEEDARQPSCMKLMPEQETYRAELKSRLRVSPGAVGFSCVDGSDLVYPSREI